MSSVEVRVDEFVLDKLRELGVTYYQKNDLPQRIKDALKGASKSGRGAGIPDFTVELKGHNKVLLIIENKWGLNNHELLNTEGEISLEDGVINAFAVNGAIHYAQQIVKSVHYDEVYAVGISGEGALDDMDTRMTTYLVRDGSIKKITIESFRHFSDNEFKDFHKQNKMTEAQKHKLIEKAQQDLGKKAKELNTLMNNNNIDVDNRVVYVSGMLLAMKDGLEPRGLKGNDPKRDDSDGKLIYSRISSFLTDHDIPVVKREMMLDTFTNIRVDADRDKPRELNTQNKSTDSVNKQLFDFIYHEIFETIQATSHLDTLGELYSEFLKFALGNGRDLGIVLSPPYTTKLMTQLINTNKDSRVLDMCTGSGGFLVSAMANMLDNAHATVKNPIELEQKEASIKGEQLRGVELNAKMYTLAATNMILRGDGSTGLIKGDAFDSSITQELEDFKADKALLNPPFSYSENGMPFALRSLDLMVPGGLLAIIIQDSAGTGRAIKTNKQILSRHTYLATIKMPADLFQPSAGVQTSIYIFEAHKPHDFRNTVRFIDFSDDGYKRTGRGTRKTGNPDKRYQNVLEVYKYGANSGVTDIEFIDACITESGDDWNFNQHRVIDTTPTEEDFMKTVGDYIQFELSQVISGRKTIEEIQAKK